MIAQLLKEDKPLASSFQCKGERKKRSKQININPEDIPNAVIGACPLKHDVRPFVLASVRQRCAPSVSLNDQLANDDTDDEEEQAQCKDAGAQAFILRHGRARHGAGVRSSHRGNLSLAQTVVLPDLFVFFS